MSLSRTSFQSDPSPEEGFATGGGIDKDFLYLLKVHPDLSLEEALRRYREEQKAKQRRRAPPPPPLIRAVGLLLTFWSG